MFWSSAPWERQASAIVGDSYAGASMSFGTQVQVWKPSTQELERELEPNHPRGVKEDPSNLGAPYMKISLPGGLSCARESAAGSTASVAATAASM